MLNIDFLEIESSSYCGADCLMCPRRERYLDKDRTLDFVLYKRLIDEAAQKLGLKMIRFCGVGDPFMDNMLLEKLEYTKTKYPHIGISATNTMHSYDERLFRYIDTLSISHYGMSKVSFEAVHRGALKYERVLENIEKLLSLDRKNRPYISMSFLILPQNESEKDHWIEHWEKRLDEVVVWKPHNWAGNMTDITTLIPRLGTPHSCGRPFYKDITVRASGKVTVCCQDYNCKLQIGDLNEDSLTDILNSEEIKRIQEIHRNETFFENDIYCNKCDQLFNRGDALVYSSKERNIGSIFLGENNNVILLDGDDTI